MLQKLGAIAEKSDFFPMIALTPGVAGAPPLYIPFYDLSTKAELRLIHNRPGPLGCENARYGSTTSQQKSGPD